MISYICITDDNELNVSNVRNRTNCSMRDKHIG